MERMARLYQPDGITKHLLVEIELCLLDELVDTPYAQALRWIRERLRNSIQEESATHYRDLAVHAIRVREMRRSA